MIIGGKEAELNGPLRVMRIPSFFMLMPRTRAQQGFSKPCPAFHSCHVFALFFARGNLMLEALPKGENVVPEI